MSTYETNRLIKRLESRLLNKKCKEVQINPICDKTSNDIVGYQAVTYNPNTPEVTIQWFDTNGDSLEAQPSNSTIC